MLRPEAAGMRGERLNQGVRKLFERSASAIKKAGDHRPEIAPRHWQWIYPVLILTGIILVGVSVLFLLADSTPAYASDTCAWAAHI